MISLACVRACYLRYDTNIASAHQVLPDYVDAMVWLNTSQWRFTCLQLRLSWQPYLNDYVEISAVWSKIPVFLDILSGRCTSGAYSWHRLKSQLFVMDTFEQSYEAMQLVEDLDRSHTTSTIRFWKSRIGRSSCFLDFFKSLIWNSYRPHWVGTVNPWFVFQKSVRLTRIIGSNPIPSFVNGRGRMSFVCRRNVQGSIKSNDRILNSIVCRRFIASN